MRPERESNSKSKDEAPSRMKAKNELKSMFTEHWKYLAVATACNLKLFDKVFEGQNSLEKLCELNGWPSKPLIFLLTHLVQDQYLKLISDSYTLCEKGDLLREQNDDGLYHACLNWSGEHLDAWRKLDYSIISGDSAFENQFQTSYFKYLETDPTKLDHYHLAMYQYATDDYQDLPDLIDFNAYQSILDVGGGYGAAIAQIKKKYPERECILFDLPEVIQNVSNTGIKKIGGDFFNEFPLQVNAMLLSRILHDWDDDNCRLILQNCFKALYTGGTLFLIENCTDLVQGDFSLLSLNMVAMCGSNERTSHEFIQLCKQCGFSYHGQKKLNDLQTILIFNK
ncbi:MAG: C-methyltransferase [Cyclobacteriaceae bacterium]|jgi:SAM-dependent methyltransferase